MPPVMRGNAGVVRLSQAYERRASRSRSDTSTPNRSEESTTSRRCCARLSMVKRDEEPLTQDMHLVSADDE